MTHVKLRREHYATGVQLLTLRDLLPYNVLSLPLYLRSMVFQIPFCKFVDVILVEFLTECSSASLQTACLPVALCISLKGIPSLSLAFYLPSDFSPLSLWTTTLCLQRPGGRAKCFLCFTKGQDQRHQLWWTRESMKCLLPLPKSMGHLGLSLGAACASWHSRGSWYPYTGLADTIPASSCINARSLRSYYAG